MSLFDQLYEKYERRLNEKTAYISSTFEDNILLMLKHLKDNDYLKQNEDIEKHAKEVLNQPRNTKEIVLDPTDETLPPMKLLLKQDTGDSESLVVTVINTKNPQEQKEFKNTMLETIFEEVIEHIKQITLQGLDTTNQAVDQLPTSEGPNAQPGEQGSALPGTENNKQTTPSV
jgi:hypothetical protein